MAAALFLLFLSACGPTPDLSETTDSADRFIQEADRCRKYKAPNSLEWPTSGVWSDGQLILADALARALVIFDPEKQQVGAKKGFNNDLNETNESLSEIRRIPDASGNYLVEDEAGTDGDHLIRLDRDLVPISTLNIQGRPLEDRAILDVIYDWQPTWIDGILGVLAFGDLQYGNSWSSSLVFFNEQGASRILKEWPISLDFVFQNTQETGYLAVIGNRGFMLVWEPEPYLLHVDLSADSQLKEPQRLELPDDLKSRAAVTHHRDWNFMIRPGEQMMLHYQVVESTPGASSIFSLDSQLFLVSRESVDQEGVKWIVSELNPDDGSELSRNRLPVSKATHHITVSIGDDAIALLEKGAAENIAAEGWVAPYLPIEDLYVVPRSWFEQGIPWSVCH